MCFAISKTVISLFFINKRKQEPRTKYNLHIYALLAYFFQFYLNINQWYIHPKSSQHD